MTEILTNSELNIPFYFLIQGSVREAARSRPTSHAGLVLKTSMSELETWKRQNIMRSNNVNGCNFQ